MNRLRTRLAARRGRRRFALLAALWTHPDGRTGLELQQAVQHSPATLFPDLATMQAEGLVWAAFRGTPAGARRFYGLTERGRRVVETGEPG